MSVCESISVLRMYVAVASLYLRDGLLVVVHIMGDFKFFSLSYFIRDQNNECCEEIFFLKQFIHIFSHIMQLLATTLIQEVESLS